VSSPTNITVAAGVPPALEPGILPGGSSPVMHEVPEAHLRLTARAAGRRPLRQARRPTLQRKNVEAYEIIYCDSFGFF